MQTVKVTQSSSRATADETTLKQARGSWSEAGDDSGKGKYSFKVGSSGSKVVIPVS
jgi:hypothetical protein